MNDQKAYDEIKNGLRRHYYNHYYFYSFLRGATLGLAIGVAAHGIEYVAKSALNHRAGVTPTDPTL